MLSTPTYDVIARIGRPPQRKPGLSYGDEAPKLQIVHWVKQGKIIDAPDLSGKLKLIYMLPKNVDRFKDEFPALRRVAEKYADRQDVAVIVLLCGERSAVDLAKFSVVRRLPCYVALDEPDRDNRNRGKTRYLIDQDRGLTANVIIDAQNKVRSYGAYVEHLQRAPQNIERLLQSQ